jgi:glycosidase
MSGGSLGASDGEEIDCDFFSLRDFWTAPGSAQFDALVNEFVEIYAFYIEQIGVDGFRIDTIKHVHREFWDAFTERLRKRVGPERAKRLILFGEVYEGSAAKIGSYTYRADWPQRREPSLDSVLHFPLCFSVRGYLRTKDKPFGNARGIESAWRDLFSEDRDGKRALYNPTPGPDGLDSRRKVINFVENHDGLNRFRVGSVSERRNQLSNALLLLAPGIPCLYYGTEADLHDTRGKIGDDSETGRLTFVAAGDAKRFTAARESASFKTIAALTELRRKLPALVNGAVSPLWADSDSADADDGVFAFARGEGSDAVIVVCNASDRERVTGVPGNAMKLVSRSGKPLLQRGEKLARIPLGDRDAAAPFEPAWKDDVPQAELRIAPESIQIYRILR